MGEIGGRRAPIFTPISHTRTNVWRCRKEGRGGKGEDACYFLLVRHDFCSPRFPPAENELKVRREFTKVVEILLEDFGTIT